jgi:hypothetical protein
MIMLEAYYGRIALHAFSRLKLLMENLVTSASMHQ